MNLSMSKAKMRTDVLYAEVRATWKCARCSATGACAPVRVNGGGGGGGPVTAITKEGRLHAGECGPVEIVTTQTRVYVSKK